MGKLFVQLALWFAIACSAFARIGETKAEIKNRYGESLPARPKTVGGQPLRVFVTAGLKVGVVFLDGKSVGEFFSKVDGTEIDSSEIEVILEANSAGSTWEKSDTGPFGLNGWVLKTGSRFAGYSNKSLIVLTQDFLSASGSDSSKEARKKLKGS